MNAAPRHKEKFTGVAVYDILFHFKELMKMNGKTGILLGSGLLLLILGAMPLNGYFVSTISPTEPQYGSFAGTTAHLLSGLIPFWIGLALLALSTNKTSHILAIPLAAICLGFLFSLPATINAKDTAHLSWLTIVAVGVMLSAATRAILNMRSTLIYEDRPIPRAPHDL